MDAQKTQQCERNVIFICVVGRNLQQPRFKSYNWKQWNVLSWSQLIISLSFKWDAFPRSHLIPPPPFNGINASSAVCQQNRLLTFSEAVPQTSSESDTESLRFEDLQVIQSFHLKFIWVSFFCWENTAQIHSKLITWMVWTTQTLWGPIGGFSKANFSSPFEFYGRYKVYSHIWSFTVTLFLSSDPNL